MSGVTAAPMSQRQRLADFRAAHQAPDPTWRATGRGRGGSLPPLRLTDFCTGCIPSAARTRLPTRLPDEEVSAFIRVNGCVDELNASAAGCYEY